jgi:broad specificity phosphatase PhoE
MTQNGHDRTTVYLIRHGETQWNTQRRWQGQADIPLNTSGIQQAELLAEWIHTRDVAFSAIYSSDLKRSFMTAQAIADRLQLETSSSQAWREIHVGKWEGLSADDINIRFPGMYEAWLDNVETFVLPNGESVGLLQKRIRAAFNEIVGKHCGEAIIVVTHGAALSALLAGLQKRNLKEAWRDPNRRIDNTGVIVVRANPTDGESEIAVYNSTEHLNGLQKAD